MHSREDVKLVDDGFVRLICHPLWLGIQPDYGWFSAAAACASILKRSCSSSLAADLSRQEFGGDVAFEFRILGFVNDTHAALPDLLKYPIM